MTAKCRTAYEGAHIPGRLKHLEIFKTGLIKASGTLVAAESPTLLELQWLLVRVFFFVLFLFFTCNKQTPCARPVLRSVK